MRHILAALVAAVVVFFWGFLAWPVVGLWDFAFPRAANEAAVSDSLKSSLGGDGAYIVPAMPEGYGRSTADPARQAEFDAFEARHRAGPFALILYRTEGSEVMPPAELLRGFAVEFVGALLLACLLSAVPGGFGRKVFFGFTIALFATTACYGVMGSFMRMPLPFILAFWADGLIAWTLASAVLAKLLPARAASAVT